MMTPTHLLLAGAIFIQPGKHRQNIAVVVGSLLPDVSIYILYFWSRIIVNISSREVWSQIYWQEPWQLLSAISNSIPLYFVMLVVGLVSRMKWLSLLAGAALIHLGLDLPFHHDDAHRHFWPLSDFRFYSPLSYWDPNHYGSYVSKVEIVIALVCTLVLWRRFEARWVKAMMGVGVVSYAAVPLYFWLTLG